MHGIRVPATNSRNCTDAGSTAYTRRQRLLEQRKCPRTPVAAARRGERVEWPTLALLAATYALWGAVTAFAGDARASGSRCRCSAILLAQHSSLQHEAIHGHPFRDQRLNDALVFPALGLLLPYERFREMHLAHHYDPLLTDPHDDPESNYLDPAVWNRLRRPVRVLLAANNTLLGRMVIGPVLGMAWLWRADPRAIAAGDRARRRAPISCTRSAILPVALWLGLVARHARSGPISLACWLALSILRVRTFLEHQAHERAGARSVIIEDRGPLALIFLNNNLHAVHHAHPNLPWYRLPGEYARRRDEFMRRNGGYRYRSYARGVRAVPAAPQGPGGAPDLDPARAPAGAASGDRTPAPAMTGGVAALPMYDWPELAAATDRLWAALRDALRAAGIAAPERLTRDRALMAVWLDPQLVLSQTCGLPIVRELAGRVAIIGAPDYGVPGCPPGFYRSVVVVRADDPRETLAAFRGARLAINGRDSQSGYGAMLHHVGAAGPRRALLRRRRGQRRPRRLDRDGRRRRGRHRRHRLRHLAHRPPLPPGSGAAARADADRRRRPGCR